MSEAQAALALSILAFTFSGAALNIRICNTPPRAKRVVVAVEHGRGPVSKPIGEQREDGTWFTRGVPLYFCLCGQRFQDADELAYHIDNPTVPF